jgi:hypothetical protein
MEMATCNIQTSLKPVIAKNNYDVNTKFTRLHNYQDLNQLSVINI